MLSGHAGSSVSLNNKSIYYIPKLAALILCRGRVPPQTDIHFGSVETMPCSQIIETFCEPSAIANNGGLAGRLSPRYQPVLCRIPLDQGGYRHIRGVISEEKAFRGQEQDFFWYLQDRFFLE